MLLTSNKKREKAIFAIFHDRYGLNEKFVHGDSPDFIGPFNGNILGVEITEIYSLDKSKGKTLREHEVAKKRIIDRAREQAIEFGLPPLHVHVLFTGNVSNDKEPYLTESLFEIVKNNYPESHSKVRLDSKNEIAKDFYAILIYNIAGPKRHIWNTSEAGGVETNFSGQLQKIIDFKSKKMSQYLSKCNRCWLIIAALGVSASNFYEIGKNMAQTCYDSAFEKVFFIEAYNGTLQELSIRKIKAEHKA